MSKRLLSGLIWMLSPFALSAQDTDFGIWTRIGVHKKISKRWTAALEGELRTHNNSQKVARWNLYTELSYMVNSYLKAGALYGFLRYNHEKRGWEPAHRASAYLNGKSRWNRLEFSLRERYQYTCRNRGKEQSPTRTHLLRSRLSIDYDIPHCKFTPCTSVELFHRLNTPNGYEKTRYTVGMDYEINKENSVSLYYRYQSEEDEEEMDMHIIGLDYKFNF